MIKEKHPLLKLKLKKEKLLIQKVINNIFESLFSLFELILNDPIENFWFEILNLFICYLQITMFIFNETVRKLFSIIIYYNENCIVFTYLESR